VTTDLTTGTDLDVALAAARAGAAALTSMYGTELERTYKTDTDFATAADLASEHAILDVIRSARPGDGFLGEELGDAGAAASDRVWLVDPLCGTLNFAARTPVFSVNVALHGPSGTEVAAVADPSAGVVYWAAGGRFGVEGGRTSGAATSLVDIDVDWAPGGEPLGPRLMADPAFRARFGARVSSTSLALAWVAAGRRAAYLVDGRHEGSVHFAAGLAVCAAAGCVVSDFRGRPVHTGDGILAAADAETHAALLDLIALHR
jgi:myo-inositol-1(or 4)-monophosphatase